MDFTGQFRLDDDSMAISIFQTPVRCIFQGILNKLYNTSILYIIYYGGIISRLYFNLVAKIYILDSEANCNSQANTNRKLFGHTDTFEQAKIQQDSPKKWSLKYISSRVVRELNNKAVGYSEICNKLTDEMLKEMEVQSDDRQKEIKNLRRRVYDALNVMISIGLVVKEKKLMRKNTETQVNFTKQNLIIRKQKQKEQLKLKREQATTLIKKQESLKKLVDLNKKRDVDENEKIRFPFLFVKTALTNADEDELVLEQNKQMDCLKVLSKNYLELSGDLCVVQKLFQNQQMIL